jgi:twitching motility two-component system response regulator PilG
LTRGVAAAKSSDAEAARGLLQRAIELDPQKELAWLWLASLSVSPVEKLAYLQRVLDINPENGHALTGIKQTRTQAAQTLLQQAATAARGGEREFARERLREAMSHDEEIEDAWLLAAYLTDDAEEKANRLRRALEINPDSSRARAALDAVEAHRDEPKWECPLCYETDDAPRDLCTHCGAHLSLENAEVFFSGNRVDEARLGQGVSRLRLRFETSDATADDCYRLGLALLNLRQTEEGIEYLRTALRLNPQNEILALAIKAILARREQASAQTEAAPKPVQPFAEDILSLDGQSEILQIDSPVQTDSFAEADESFAAVSSADESFPAKSSAAPSASSFETVGISASLPSNDEAHAGRTIMIVDDSPTVRKLVTIKLEKQGHRVIPAVDGMEALAMLNEDLPDLILLDITMPRMDGYQLCKLVRANPTMKHIPIVMLSGKDGFFDKVRGKMAGSTAYLTKPFEPETLLRVVAEHCGTTV